MICTACNGEDPDCFQCAGTGHTCDRCGEAVDDPGMDVCQLCNDEEGS